MTEYFEGNLGRPRALVAPCILLLLAEAPSHGYELMERLKRLGFDWDGPGPIYRELHLLEASNLLMSTWPARKAGPVPRVYELTATGRQALERSAAGITALQDLLAEYLARFGNITACSGSSQGPGDARDVPQGRSTSTSACSRG